MSTLIHARRRSPVLSPSSLACLSTLPTINLTAGCLHDCVYCYIRGYSGYPGPSTVVLYEDTLERLQRELVLRRGKPRAVYFSPSSDLFQPEPAVLDLTERVLRFLFAQGIGVAFLTKGAIPDRILDLLAGHAALVHAQVGITTLDQRISHAFEPRAAAPPRRLEQIAALIHAGIATEARLDPILPGITDADADLDLLLAALAAAGVREVAAGMLFLRPSIVRELRAGISDQALLTSLFRAYTLRERVPIRAGHSTVLTLPAAARQAVFQRLRRIAEAHGVHVNICACKNPDIATGTCNIAGRWPNPTCSAGQCALV